MIIIIVISVSSSVRTKVNTEGTTLFQHAEVRTKVNTEGTTLK